MADYPLSRQLLRQLTLIYLGVPVAIFLLGWLRLPLALLMVALLAWTCRRAGWRRETEREPRRLSPRAFLLGGVLPSVVFVALSGAGGWGSGDSDWYKHDTILFDLIQRPWPVTYQMSTGPALLVYYVAFYLPAALVGKWTGSWMLASHTLALTMLAGILLSLGWLALLGTTGGAAGDHRPPRPRTGWWWRAAAVFFCFSGLDTVGKFGVNLYLHHPAFAGDWYDIAWWAQAFQYPSNAAALFWAPHQAIGAWLPCALVLESGWRTVQASDDSPGHDGSERVEGPGAVPLSLAWSWSPFAAIGLAPLFAGLIFFRARDPSTTFKQRLAQAVFSPVNLGAAALALVTTAFYAARLTAFALPAFARVPPGRSPAPLITEGLMPMPLLYFVFILLEFGLLAAALRWAMSQRHPAPAPSQAPWREDQLLLAIATLILLLLPLVHYGYANDLVMRGGLPALFVLQVLVVRALAQKPPRGLPWALVAIITLLALGASNTFLEYRRHVDRMLRDKSWRDVARDDFAAKRQDRPLPVWSLFELQRGIYHRPGFDFARQYLGSTESFYQHHLAPRKQAAPQRVRE